MANMEKLDLETYLKQFDELNDICEKLLDLNKRLIISNPSCKFNDFNERLYYKLTEAVDMILVEQRKNAKVLTEMVN